MKMLRRLATPTMLRRQKVSGLLTLIDKLACAQALFETDDAVLVRRREGPRVEADEHQSDREGYEGRVVPGDVVNQRRDSPGPERRRDNGDRDDLPASTANHAVRRSGGGGRSVDMTVPTSGLFSSIGTKPLRNEG